MEKNVKRQKYKWGKRVLKYLSKCDINQVKCLAQSFPPFPIKMGRKKIFFIQIITL